MGCADAAMSAIARKGRTLGMELRSLETGAGMARVSKTAYLKSRMKIRPDAFRQVARRHAASVYEDGDFEAWHGCLLLAADGSTFNAPTNEATLEAYGNSSSHGRPQATGCLQGLCDVLNRQLIDLEAGPFGADGRAGALRQVGRLGEVIGDLPYILAMDRGYASLALMWALGEEGALFVIRYPKGSLDSEFAQAAEAGGDAWVDVGLTKQRLRDIRRRDPESAEALAALGSLRLRLLVLDVGTGEPERIATNLPPGGFTADDVKEAYRLRWGVETCFGVLKDKLQLENFTGARPVLIEQDIYAAMHLLNVAFDLANEADRGRDREADAGRRRHEMTVNRGMAIGVLKAELFRLIAAPPGEREAIIAGIVEELRGHLVPVRPGRSYPRSQAKAPRHNRNSNTHKRVF